MPARPDWKWLFFQVGLPLLGPTVLSFVVVGLYWTAKPNFRPDIDMVLDTTPWALATYSLTLVGVTLGKLVGSFSKYLWIGVGLIGVAVVNILYYAFLVILRHDPAFRVASESYYVMGLLVAASIAMCYRVR